MEKHRSKFFTVVTLIGSLLTAGILVLSSMKVNNDVPVTSNYALEAKSKEPAKETTVDYLAPNGKATLTMKNGKEVKGVFTQTFYITSEEDKKPVKIFERDSSSDNLISVHHNTFSPDNKFIFLKSEDSGKTQYIVMRTDGKDIKEGSQNVEIVSLFSEKHPDFVITDVTGWGSYSLIVVNTDTKDGKLGPSWWFDLSNFSFIRLSTRFN